MLLYHHLNLIAFFLIACSLIERISALESLKIVSLSLLVAVTALPLHFGLRCCEINVEMPLFVCITIEEQRSVIRFRWCVNLSEN